MTFPMDLTLGRFSVSLHLVVAAGEMQICSDRASLQPFYRDQRILPR